MKLNQTKPAEIMTDIHRSLVIPLQSAGAKEYANCTSAEE